MKWEIVSVGKPSLPWAREAASDYLSRLQRKGSIEIKRVRAVPAATLPERMIEACGGARRIVLDERGRMMSSMEFAQWIGRQEIGGCKRVSVLIGGADGHAPAVREAADEMWSLSPMTLQHELALVLFLEQLYRALSILRGEPYHRTGDERA